MKKPELYIGIDMGGSNIRGIAYKCDSGNLSHIYRHAFIRSENVFDEVNENLIQLVKQICMDNSESTLSGIGIAMAPLFERKSGDIVEWPNNRKWKGFPIADYLQRIFKVPIILEDDANASALGEYLAGAGKGVANFLYITVSTGIGCGIISAGNLIVGEHGWAGEIGHIKVSKNPRVICKCGATGCLQAIASGPAILSNYNRVIERKTHLEYQYTLKEIAQKAYEGDICAQRAFYQAGIEIGNALANLVLLLDCSLIIVGGGVINAGRWIINPIKEGISSCLQNRRSVEVVRSKLHDMNGLLGALAKIDLAIHNSYTIEVEKWII